MTDGYGKGRARARPIAKPKRMNAPRPKAELAAPIPKDVRGKINFGEGPVVPLFILGTGMYLAWFGVHYWRSDVRWPTDPIKAVLQGKPLPGAAKTPSADEQAVLNSAQGQHAASASLVEGALAPVTGASSASSSSNVNTGKLLAAAYGWGPGTKDWPYLESGWNEESGWRTDAAYDKTDPYNHAYGIPQSNPGTKMAAAGPNWKTDAATQIRWGLAYIKATYGAPSRVPGWTPNGPASGYQGY